MDITPVDRSIRKRLESDFYKVPRFQRPYSWKKSHVEGLWDDDLGGNRGGIPSSRLLRHSSPELGSQRKRRTRIDVQGT